MRFGLFRDGHQLLVQQGWVTQGVMQGVMQSWCVLQRSVLRDKVLQRSVLQGWVLQSSVLIGFALQNSLQLSSVPRHNSEGVHAWRGQQRGRDA